MKSWVDWLIAAAVFLILVMVAGLCAALLMDAFSRPPWMFMF